MHSGFESIRLENLFFAFLDLGITKAIAVIKTIVVTKQIRIMRTKEWTNRLRVLSLEEDDPQENMPKH